eukprot:2920756-Prymnesium_polylepis.1
MPLPDYACRGLLDGTSARGHVSGSRPNRARAHAPTRTCHTLQPREGTLQPYDWLVTPTPRDWPGVCPPAPGASVYARTRERPALC